ncbi:protein phosphatase 2C domain-containing protein [Nocardiopsis flavescens]|uniref:protein phosphatase 2C domain-containing protein n=1 Tax=Nocardiopsis flavescens TaxID=758803 RepID=UPI003669E121
MKLFDKAEGPGSPTKPSEDRLGSSGNLFWVIDGASDFSDESTLPGKSNVHWLVDYVQEKLQSYGKEGTCDGSESLFKRLHHDARREIEKYDTSIMKNHPCCSIGVAITLEKEIELSRVGDATLVAYLNDESFVEMCTPFFDQREENAVRESLFNHYSRDEIMERIFERRLEYIKGVHTESVFSGHPQAKLKVHSKKIPLDRVSAVLACTDGFSRAVNDYGIYSGWNDLSKSLQSDGLDQVVQNIRRHEIHLAEQKDRPKKFKKSDDVAVILMK